MSFTKEQRESHLARSKEQAIRAAKNRAKSGVTISRYLKNKGMSKYLTVHVNYVGFPKPVEIVGGLRMLKYYNVVQLDNYFARLKTPNAPKLIKVKATTLMHKFITTKWVGQEIPTRCTLAEDSYIEP